MSVLAQVLAANAEYVGTFGEKSELALPPARGFAILTCMDARLDPAKYAGLAEGDAHVIRNAGGRALRSSRRPRRRGRGGDGGPPARIAGVLFGPCARPA